MSQSRILYNGQNPTYGYVEGVYPEDFWLSVGENTFESWDVAVDQVIEVGHILAINAANQAVIVDDANPAADGGTPYAIATHPLSTVGRTEPVPMRLLVRTMGTINAEIVQFNGFGGDVNGLRLPLSNGGISLDTQIYSAIDPE